MSDIVPARWGSRTPGVRPGASREERRRAEQLSAEQSEAVYAENARAGLVRTRIQNISSTVRVAQTHVGVMSMVGENVAAMVPHSRQRIDSITDIGTALIAETLEDLRG